MKSERTALEFSKIIPMWTFSRREDLAGGTCSIRNRRKKLNTLLAGFESDDADVEVCLGGALWELCGAGSRGFGAGD